MKTVFHIFLFLPSLFNCFHTCCKEGEALKILGAHTYCVANQKSTVSKNQLLGGQTSSGVKYPACTEFEYFEVKYIYFEKSSSYRVTQKDVMIDWRLYKTLISLKSI